MAEDRISGFNLKKEIARIAVRLGREALKSNNAMEMARYSSAIALLNQAQLIAGIDDSLGRRLLNTAKRFI